jgi:hypothetical protein
MVSLEIEYNQTSSPYLALNKQTFPFAIYVDETYLDVKVELVVINRISNNLTKYEYDLKPCNFSYFPNFSLQMTKFKCVDYYEKELISVSEKTVQNFSKL